MSGRPNALRKSEMGGIANAGEFEATMYMHLIYDEGMTSAVGVAVLEVLPRENLLENVAPLAENLDTMAAGMNLPVAR
ncbi:MAG: hypothetical protein Q8P60_03265 [Pseudorhodobacter sp.]|nr:hypothetical protein [Pseudorhodobacter sp.]